MSAMQRSPFEDAFSADSLESTRTPASEGQGDEGIQMAGAGGLFANRDICVQQASLSEEGPGGFEKRQYLLSLVSRACVCMRACVYARVYYNSCVFVRAREKGKEKGRVSSCKTSQIFFWWG